MTSDVGRSTQPNIYDVVVIGTGAGGLSAAITARSLGLNVLVVEKEPVYGGTTARAGGGLWIPGNAYAAAAGIIDSSDAARKYIEQSTGNRFEPARVDAFLRYGPEMLDFFERKTELHFMLAPGYPDYHPDDAGAMRGGRTVFPLPFDASILGKELYRLGRPIKELTFLGMHIGSGRDLVHFFNVTTSARSAAFVVRKLLNHFLDVLIHRRATHLSNGMALVARLLKTAMDLGIPIWTSSRAASLITRNGRVVGVKVERRGQLVELGARRGVVLACGGFPHDIDRKRQFYNHAPTGREHWSAAPFGNTGDGLRMAEAVGATVKDNLSNAGAWAPVSLVPRRSGEPGVFPHFMDRQKPGRIAVTRAGKRFTNEADSYHDFVQAMVRACEEQDEVCAFLIADYHSLRRYGMGAARPRPVPYGHLLRSGYLVRGNTIAELAERAGIDADQLTRTVEAFNSAARRGEDPMFGRGRNAYNLYFGDPEQKPNPCVGPIERSPFFALKLVPGDLGTFAGLQTDEKARVVDRAGRPIAGLYAAGNDLASIFAGDYPGGGSTLGPGMTFGYIAGRDLAESDGTTGI
jgi:succinate dehydrogenase/fumarate reductase flavoprotein subunit